jgi:hypothetical protein
MVVMNIAEIKLDLFRKIDSLNETEFEKIYKKFLAILNTTSIYSMTEAENRAIDEALESDETYGHDEVIEDAKKRYPNLKFR